MEMTGFPYSEEGAITSIALGPLSSERWESFLLVLSFTRIREKKRKKDNERERKHTHTKPQPLSGVVEAGLSRGTDRSPNPAGEGQAGGGGTRGAPRTAVLDLKAATKARAGQAPGPHGMPALGLDHTWLRLPSALGGPGEPRAKLALFLYTSDALGLPFFSGTEVRGHGAARPAPPPPLMNEGEHTLDPGLEAPRGGTRVVGVSLEIGDSRLLASQRPGRLSRAGTEHQAPPCHGGAAAFLLQQEPAQRMQYHRISRSCLESMECGWGEPGGEAWMGPRARV